MMEQLKDKKQPELKYTLIFSPKSHLLVESTNLGWCSLSYVSYKMFEAI